MKMQKCKNPPHLRDFSHTAILKEGKPDETLRNDSERPNRKTETHRLLGL